MVIRAVKAEEKYLMFPYGCHVKGRGNLVVLVDMSQTIRKNRRD